MQIKRLKIDDHLCLVDFEINFQTVNGGSSTILIGENGTGKSTLIETILTIFMSFDSPNIEKEIDYYYSIDYEYAQERYVITQKRHIYQIECQDTFFDGTYKEVREFLKEKSIFPQRIIAFYSGANNKIKNQINRVNGNYASMCRQTIQSFYSKEIEKKTWFAKRKYIYCREDLTPVYLVSIIGGQDSFEKEYLVKQCAISAIDSIQISISVPFASRIINQRSIEKNEKDAILKIVDYIDDRMTDSFQEGFRYATTKQAIFELNNTNFHGMDSVDIYNFFEKLQTLLNGKFEAYVIIGNKRVKSHDLSEGQRQLIKMLGMLGVCKSEDTLVLLDEPDAHMNPRWKYEIKKTIDDCLKGSINTQAIIATHDPLVINGVDKKQIRIFELDTEGNTNVIEPTENTEGLGIDGLLQSEYYGLSTVLDSETRKKMDAKNDLLVKKTEGTLSEPEKHKLKALSDELENMTFARNIPTDQYYDEYVAAMHKIYRDRPKTTLSAEDIKERNAKAEEILQRLLEK